MIKYKYISLYSCEKKQACNVGTIQVRVDFEDDDDFRKQKEELKEKQKLINLEYRKLHPVIKKGKPAGKAVYDPMIGNRNESQNIGVNKVSNLLNDVTSGLPDIKLDHSMMSDDYEKSQGNSIVIFGASRAGKSYVLKALYDKYYKDVPKKMKLHSMLFSYSSSAEVYKSLPKSVHICNKFDVEGAKLIKQLKKINEVSDLKFNFLVLMDDVTDIRYSQTINQLILVNRNMNFNCIISLQYVNLLGKSARGSINHSIFGSMNNDESIVCVLKSFLGSKFSEMGFHTLASQIQLYKKLTSDYHFIYYFPRKNHISRFKLQL